MARHITKVTHHLMVIRTFVLLAVLVSSLLLPASVKASVRLDVPFHRQEHSLSCEVATLKMALDYHEVVVSEAELIAKLPFDPTIKGSGVWGNPNEGFVGSIDGKMLVDGYGVYWDPIALLASQYAQTEVIEHGSAQELARHLMAGNPVIIWGYYGKREVYGWPTAAGEYVKAVNGEHTRIVYGFDGTAQNPTRFYLLDPLYGRMTWSTQELMYNWSGLNHMGVVVAPAASWVRVPGENKVWEIDETTQTRRWVTSWQALERRGGSRSVAAIAESKLMRYTRGADIE